MNFLKFFGGGKEKHQKGPPPEAVSVRAAVADMAAEEEAVFGTEQLKPDELSGQIVKAFEKKYCGGNPVGACNFSVSTHPAALQLNTAIGRLTEHAHRRLVELLAQKLTYVVQDFDINTETGEISFSYVVPEEDSFAS